MVFNPWRVKSVEAFNFLCCPECVFRAKECNSFEAHALQNHPLSTTLFGSKSTDEPFEFDSQSITSLGGVYTDNEEIIELDDEVTDNDIEIEEHKIEVTVSMDDTELSKLPECNTAADPLENECANIIKRISGLTCTKCSSMFNTRLELAKHVKELHSEDIKIPCPCCSRSVKFCDLKSHYEDSHCVAFCPETFEISFLPKTEPKVKSKVKPKVKQKVTPKIFKCQMCSYTAKNRICLKVHNKNYHEGDKAKFTLDDIRVDDDGTVKCPECSELVNDQYYIAHFKRFHKRLPPNFPESETKICEWCSEPFSSEKNLMEHIERKHEVDKPPEQTTYTCKVCNGTFLGRYGYTRHYTKTHHDYPPEFRSKENVVCDQCGLTYKNQEYLQRHKQMVHENVKTKRIRKKHNKTGKKKDCPYCDRSFVTALSFNEHVRKVHEKKTPFHCQECPRKFGVKAILESHMKTKHTRVNCEICDTVLYNYSNLKTHKFKEHGIIPKGGTKCELCDSIFMTETNLKKHMASKHSD